MQRDPGKTFTLAPHVWLEFLTRTVQSLVRADTFIQETFEIYQSLRSFVIPKQISKEKRMYMETTIAAYLENGFSKTSDRNSPPNLFQIKFEPRGPDGFMSYGSLQEYIGEHTKVETLSFDKLICLFRIYFVLISGILIMNFVHYFKAVNKFVKASNRLRIRLLRAIRKLFSLIRKLCIIFKRQFASFRSASFCGIKLRK